MQPPHSSHFQFRVAACGGSVRSADLRDTRCGPPQDGGSGPLRFLAGTANSAFKIQDSKLKGTAGPAWTSILVRAAACGGRMFGNELRASARGGCGPLGPGGPVQSTRSKPAAERTGLHKRPADARLQPSARGRLRAAGRYATAFSNSRSLSEPHPAPLPPFPFSRILYYLFYL